MMRATTIALPFAALLAASCASVARDAGVAGVQSAVSARAGQTVEWRAQPSATDDPRVSAMLEGELTADKAVAVAMVNSPRLQAALAELGVARADLIEASTISNPLFELELRVPGEPYRPYELRLAQSLIDLIQLPRRRALGRAAFDVAQMRISADVLRLGADVRSTYFDVLAATQHVAQSGIIMEAAKAAAEVAVKQHAAENITDLDLENEQALYEQSKLDLARAERTLVVAREELLRSMGLRDATLQWRVPASFPELPATELDQRELEERAAKQRLDLAIAHREVDIAARQVPMARLASLGEVLADVHYEKEPSGEHTVGPGVEFPIPLFNTGRAARTRAEAQWLRARYLLDAMTVESSSRLRAASATLAEARARVEYYRDVILPRRRRIVQLTTLEHNAMLVGVFQLLQARQNEAQAESDFIDAQREYWGARSSLERVLVGIEDDASPRSQDTLGRQAGTGRGDH